MITPKTPNIDIERSILVRYKFRIQNLAKSNICSTTETNLSNGCINIYMNLVVRKPVFGVSDLIRHKPDCTTTHTMARCLKFRIYEVEGLYYLSCENKGAD